MEVKLPFGVRNNKIIHISEILDSEKGLKCNCVCPQCNQRLVAKLGNIRTRHFSHHNQNCKYATETAIHKFAKEVLKESMEIVLPKLTILYDKESFDIVKNSHFDYSGSYIRQENLKKVEIVNKPAVTFDKIELEERMDSIIPDVVIYKNGKPLIIEIAVTHFINHEKEEKIKKMDISTIEISLDFDDINYSNFDREKVKNLIINGMENKRWIYNSQENNKEKELQKKHQEYLSRKAQYEKMELERRENRKQIQLQKIKYLESTAQKRFEEYDRNLDKNKLWIQICKELNITKDSIPEYLDCAVNGELAFRCDRRIWQSCIYKKFILHRKGKIIYVFNVVRWIKLHSHIPRNQELDFTNNFAGDYIYSLTDAVIGFLNNLVMSGVLVNLSYRNNFYSSYEIKKDDLFAEEVEEVKFIKDDLLPEKIEEVKFVKKENSVSIQDKKAKCRICGTETRDWIVFYGNDENTTCTCICRECRLSGRG